MKIRGLREFFLYCFIGIINTGIHFFVFIFAANYFSQTISNCLAFSFAVVFSFFCNSIFTFKKEPSKKRFIKMYLSMLLVSAGFGYIGDFFNLYPLITILIYFVLNPIIGFVVTKYFVFGR
ncbi:GtrA family protein [Parasutterella excrementihominis]|jgi:putative flippase GtrA|uniref:GtrA family protein n=1 Tax=Parasutterella excrementihominis TaxID=487175 RepID=UPI003465F9EB